MPAELQLEFEGDVLGSGYFLRATVIHTVELPLPCLVYQRGSNIQQERLIRVATLADLELLEMDTPHDTFSGVALETKNWVWPPPPGMEHAIYVSAVQEEHPEWYKLDPAFTTKRVVAEILSENRVRVRTPYPAFGNRMYYKYSYQDPMSPDPPLPGEMLGNDGVADRNYHAYTSLYFRTHSAFMLFDNLTDAENKKRNLQAEAQSLVDAVNSEYPTYSGDDTYDYS